MSNVVYREKERVAHYVMQGIIEYDPKLSVRNFDPSFNLGPYEAIGVENEQKELIAGCIYNNMRTWAGRPFDIHMNLYATDPNWCTRSNMKEFLSYPFYQLGVKRLSALTSKDNKVVRGLMDRFGWVLEGNMKHGFDGIRDGLMYALYPSTVERWLIEETDNGKRRRISPSSA